MRQMTFVVLSLLAVAVAGGTEPTSRPTSKPATREALPFREALLQIAEAESLNFRDIVETLGIEGDQAKRIAARRQQREARIAELKSTRREEWAAFEQMPLPGPDESLVERFGKHEKLMRAIAAIDQPYVREVLNELTPEQLLRWYTLHLQDQVSDEEGIIGVDLTVEQQRAVDAICVAAAKEIIALGDARTLDRMAEIDARARKLCREKVRALQKREPAPWGSEKPLK